MRRAILDTDTLSEHLKDRDTAVMAHGDRYAVEHGRFESTSVTAQAARFAAWAVRNIERLPTREGYRLAAEVRGTARTKGRTLELSDCLIAAVASRLGLPLVTGSIAYYEAIQDAGLDFEIENRRLP